MSFGDLINILKCICPSRPGGHGQGGHGHAHCHGRRLPNQLLMSPEIVRYIEDAEEHTQQDKLKKEKDEFSFDWKI